MTVRPYAPGAVASFRNSDRFVAMQRQMDDLQRQLTTGKKADSFAGLGFERRSSLDFRGKISMLTGYQSTIETGTLRLKVMTQLTERLDVMARDTQSDLMNAGFVVGTDGRSRQQQLAEQRLREAIDHLNEHLNGRYLFAGRNVDAPPVETYQRIMEGDASVNRAGLKTVIAERIAAEVGLDGLGRLATAVQAPVPPATSPYTLQVTGNAAALPFGFELVSTGSSSAVISGGAAGGAPPQVNLTVSGIPANNDTVDVVVRDKDGVTHSIQLIAKTTISSGDRNVFQIGIDENTTVNGPNGLRAAVEAAIRDKATAVLKPRAAVLAAEEFFDGSLSNAPDRVAAPASLLTVTNPAADTVQLTGDATTTFGFEILATTTDTGANITTTFTPATIGPPATPEDAQFQFTAVPADGDTIVVQLQDRTGAPHTVTLTARTTPTSNPNEFQIGADVATTIGGANGLNVALDRALAAKATEVLMGEATAMDTSGTRQTLIWYKGDDASTPLARDTAPLRIDTSHVVGTGARANEPAIRSMLVQFSVLAEATFTNTDAERERSNNLTLRVRDNLSPPPGQQRLEDIATDFGTIVATLDAAKERHQVAENILQDTIDKVESASVEETGTAILTLQMRLEASYQTTSMLSRLSLVNFL